MAATGKKVTTTIYMTKEQDRQLTLLSLATGRSKAHHIREGIELALKKHKDLFPRQLGLLGEG